MELIIFPNYTSNNMILVNYFFVELVSKTSTMDILCQTKVHDLFLFRFFFFFGLLFYMTRFYWTKKARNANYRKPKTPTTLKKTTILGHNYRTNKFLKKKKKTIEQIMKDKSKPQLQTKYCDYLSNTSKGNLQWSCFQYLKQNDYKNLSGH